MSYNPIKQITNLKDVLDVQKQPWNRKVKSNNTYEMFKEVAKKYREKIAIIYLPKCTLDEMPVKLTFGQFFKKITRTANLFRDFGVQNNDVVSFLLPSIPQTQFVMWGAQAVGAVNPINFLLKPETIAELVNAAKSKILVTMAPGPGFPFWEKIEKIRNEIPTLRQIFVIGNTQSNPPNTLNFDEEIIKYSADHLQFERSFNRADISTIFHTGGTTGKPKLAPHTQENDIFAAWACAHLWNYYEGAILINALPMFHVAGSINLSLSALTNGCSLLLPGGGFRNPNFLKNHWKIAEKYCVSHIGGVPTSLGALLQTPIKDANIDCIKYVLSGGAALPSEVEDNFLEIYGLKISQMYGMTEAGSTISMNPAGFPKIRSAGLILPYVKLKSVILAKDGSYEEVQLGELGTIIIKGPNIFPGYLDPDYNETIFTPDKWLITGDIGRIDEKGFLYLTGRSKDLIIRSSHNIDPKIIENVASRHSAVEIAAAVGKPDEYAGELPILFVQLKPHAESTEKDILQFVSQQVYDKPAKPTEVYILQKMPLTGVGKIFKPKLRWTAIEKVFLERLLNMEISNEQINWEIKVGESRKYGIIANVIIENRSKIPKAIIVSKVRAILGKFIIKYKIEWK